jgi:hypothetical protein
MSKIQEIATPLPRLAMTIKWDSYGLFVISTEGRNLPNSTIHSGDLSLRSR